MIGTRLDGKYELVGKLGSGAMGDVYEARNVATGRRVAVKVIQGMLVQDEGVVARFQREARAAGAIESRYIAQVHDAGTDAATGSPYLVMELLVGEDVDGLLRRLGPLRPELALRIAAQALAGLDRAHAAKVIHRDLKPANLYVAQSDGGARVVKVVDFGIAKVKDDLATSRDHALTQTSALLGSPMYMSPEQAKASKTVDARADLWSMGIVLHQLLTGRTPHAHAESLTELLLAICTEKARPVQDEAPWVPAEVAMIVEKALRIDPAQRYATAGEMLSAIAELVPDWQLLGDAMLTPMSEEERVHVAPRAPLAPPGDVNATTGPALDRTLQGEEPPPALAASSGSAPALAASHARTDAGAGKPARGARAIAPIAIGGAMALLAAGFVGARALGGGAATASSAAPAGLAPTAAIEATAAPTEPPAAAPAATSASPTAAASAEASAAATASPSPRPGPRPAPVRPSAIAPAAAPPSGRPAAPAPPKSAAPKPSAPPSPISREFE